MTKVNLRKPCQYCGWPGAAGTRINHTLWNIRNTMLSKPLPEPEPAWVDVNKDWEKR